MIGAKDSDGRTTPAAVESEQALCGALVRGLHVPAIRAVVRPDQLWRRDHRIIMRAAFDLHARGVTPDAPLIVSGVSEPLDGSPAYVYQLSDHALGLTPDKIGEHARRIHAADHARRLLALCDRASARLRDDPDVALNGLPGELIRDVDALRAEAPTASRVSETLPELAARLAEAYTRDMLIGDLFALGEIAMLHGQPRDGKTWTADELGIAVAIQLRAFGLDRFEAPQSRRVLIVSNEDSPASYLRRLELLCAGHGLQTLPDSILLMVGRGVSLDDRAWHERLIDEIRRDAIALLIVDPLRSVTAAADQGPAELRPVATYLRRLVAETGCGVLLVHHDTKPQAGLSDTRRRAQRASGGGVFSIVDCPIHVERIDEHRSLLTPDGFKHSTDPAPVIVERQTGDGWVRLVGETATADAAGELALHDRIRAYLRQNPGASGNRVAAGIHGNKQTVLRALEALSAVNDVDAVRERRGTKWFIRDDETRAETENKTPVPPVPTGSRTGTGSGSTPLGGNRTGTSLGTTSSVAGEDSSRAHF